MALFKNHDVLFYNYELGLHRFVLVCVNFEQTKSLTPLHVRLQLYTITH